MLRSVSIAGYRSIRELRFGLSRVTVVIGENGAGKTNLYRALSLLRDAASGSLARSIAQEGGMGSALWAGSSAGEAASEIRLDAEVDDLRYGLRLGLPGPNDPALALDPVVREEIVAAKLGARMPTMLQRKGPSVTARAPDGRWAPYPNALLMAETALAMLRDPRQFPELDRLQRAVTDWRFHHVFRTDEDSPIRQPQVSVCSPTLDANGANLAAALATALHLGNGGGEDYRGSDIGNAIEDAFPGARLDFIHTGGKTAPALHMPGLGRAFAAHELSDGMLRYLSLVGALCAYRRPAFIALNEPEASLHPSLIAPLARLIIAASREAQVLVVTHAPKLAEMLEIEGGAERIALEKRQGETIRVG